VKRHVARMHIVLENQPLCKDMLHTCILY